MIVNYRLTGEALDVHVVDGVAVGLIVEDIVVVVEPDGVGVVVADSVEVVVTEALGEAVGEEEALVVAVGDSVGVRCRHKCKKDNF